MKIKEVMILAGGLGTRLRSTVPDLPKVLAPVNNRPFLFYILDHWVNQGIKKFVICVGYKADYVKNEIINSPFKNYVKFSHETKKLGTGGAILNGLSLINSKNFIVQNGDTFIPIKLNEVYKLKNIIKKTVFMMLIKQIDINRYGVFLLNKNNNVLMNNYNEKNENLINAGVYILNKEKLEQQNFNKYEELSFENYVLPILIEKMEVSGEQFYETFIDIGIPIDYKRAYKIVSKSFVKE